MKAEITSVTVAAPTDVGEKGHEFFVHLRVDEKEFVVDATGDLLLDPWKFQIVALMHTGYLADFGITAATGNIDALRRWQELLQGVPWKRTSENTFEEDHVDKMNEDDDDSFYRFVEVE